MNITPQQSLFAGDQAVIKNEETKVVGKPNHPEEPNEIEVLLEQISELAGQHDSLSAVINLQTEDFHHRLGEKDKQHQRLLAHLNTQEELHFHEISELQHQLEAKNQQCVELQQSLERQRSIQEQNNSCSICLDCWNSSAGHAPVSLRCGHLFGYSCICYYLRRARYCPQCRRPAEPYDIRPIFLGS
ncbi:E3 ubiquitin-protein ligase rnf8-B-like [Drosophila busckii]|uniref:E3 ubiquitin-protein ligase rnf8-B-like n=1 Tax=Drosophila busckii TaxID=30019 RepID=UPI00083F1AD3|nr:E3 ubiquitin-protein ligase rnf8-B-like [Drosophila busckii]